ncbi:hypothetical protein EWM64_g4402 [Hericium alpestre]|uniref:Uncharacterized protein n=1 Tax=Hericium alpestre TaxID=135208 RepID=A0A4Y9ZYL1_9AGAM|nr:hypothetical protein EWM64_g4402 [Hericium alpestre]
MNSPIEPASPVSTASSDSLGEDVPQFALNQPTVQATQSSAKRRLGPASNTRDPKTRRREEFNSRKGVMHVEAGREEGGSGSRRPKEDLLDVHLVESLRRRIGDPFDDDIIKNVS